MGERHDSNVDKESIGRKAASPEYLPSITRTRRSNQDVRGIRDMRYSGLHSCYFGFDFAITVTVGDVK